MIFQFTADICDTIAENIKIDMEQGINDQAKAIFCDLDTDEKRALVACPSLNGAMVEELLTPDVKCNKTMDWNDDSQMIFTDPLVIEKAERECGENPICLQLKAQISKSIKAQSSMMDKYFGDMETFFNKTGPILKDINDKFIDYLNKKHVNPLTEDAMNKQLDSILQVYFPGWEKNGEDGKGTEQYEAIFKIQKQYKAANAFDPTVMASNQDIIDSTKKIARAQYNVKFFVLVH